MVFYLSRPQGRIAYDRIGEGPLVLLVPGMGDLRQSYRLLAPELAAAGYQVLTTDLRGHGESDATFTNYGDDSTAEDLIALLEQQRRPAVIVGNSMAAAAAVIVAATRPDLVAGLVLLGPFVRNGSGGRLKQLAMRVLLAPPWVVPIWNMYLPTLYAGARPEDFEEYRSRVIASLRRPGYASAFSRTARTSHDRSAQLLDQVATPSLTLMGADDPDFPDPEAEAAWISPQLAGDYAMIADAGHYPQAQQPERTRTAIESFLQRISSHD